MDNKQNEIPEFSHQIVHLPQVTDPSGKGWTFECNVLGHRFVASCIKGNTKRIVYAIGLVPVQQGELTDEPSIQVKCWMQDFEDYAPVKAALQGVALAYAYKHGPKQ
jgi:hypothetical protein